MRPIPLLMEGGFCSCSLLKNCCCVELVALMFTSAKTTKISQGSADGYGQDKSR
jgi:hypothetical protein